jgi:DNA-binding transcriptional LysR family regulator
VIIEASSLDFIVGYVKQNKGVSFMFEPDIREELARGTLKVIFVEEGNIIFFTDIIYHSEKTLSPPGQAFLNVVNDLRRESVLPTAIVTS